MMCNSNKIVTRSNTSSTNVQQEEDSGNNNDKRNVSDEDEVALNATTATVDTSSSYDPEDDEGQEQDDASSMEDGDKEGSKKKKNKRGGGSSKKKKGNRSSPRRVASTAAAAAAGAGSASKKSNSINRMVVDHTYYDHYHDPIVSASSSNQAAAAAAAAAAVAASKSCNGGGAASGGSSNSKKGPRGGVTVAFPERLYEMLRIVHEDGLDDIVSWMPHGRAFLVKDKTIFVNDVMPRFFHQSKLTSFQRQLNLYGFVRLTAGPDRGSYYHELFLRGRPDLCCLMVRTRVKGNGMKAASSPSTEPNFYSMEPCIEGDCDPATAAACYEATDFKPRLLNIQPNTKIEEDEEEEDEDDHSSEMKDVDDNEDDKEEDHDPEDPESKIDPDNIETDPDPFPLNLPPFAEPIPSSIFYLNKIPPIGAMPLASCFPSSDSLSTEQQPERYCSSWGGPAVVSLPSTPQSLCKQTKKNVGTSSNLDEIMKSVSEAADVDIPFEVMMPPPTDDDMLEDEHRALFWNFPHTGDEVFFEGSKFRYLDHLELDDIEGPMKDAAEDDDKSGNDTASTSESSRQIPSFLSFAAV